MTDIESCDNQILGEDEFDQNEYDLAEEQSELRSELEQMCQELGNLKEVMNLKTLADCDCSYKPIGVKTIQRIGVCLQPGESVTLEMFFPKPS